MKQLMIRSLLLIVCGMLFVAHSVGLGLTTYFHEDHLGSPVYASDEFGDVLWQERYKPFGEKIDNSPASAANDIWYTGKPHDDDTGLTYMNARYYDPVIGRFMAVDPVGFTQSNTMSFNRYLYVNNNPYKYNDPDGEFLNFIIGGAWAAAQNIALQNIEIALGVREEFSYGELALDTALGVATSGLSTIKNGGRLAITAAKVANQAKKITVSARFVAGKSFKSFDALKRHLGPAGKNRAWHHLVEQTPANLKKFGSKFIQNTGNVVNVPHAKGLLHMKISGYYSSKKAFTNGKTVRKWLESKSFDEQYEFGVKMLKEFQK